ncbi:kappaPI-actitoxin-Avd3b-like [Oppia nitens]|uniref:kappaPI-actitoxin-Avd3b-like n=1 Tax=Oppia nitens TaxID=1686743 RepID=UPI0023DCA167|nr:kappaPI-actitoxin-Avd3b-like [Oppia nitens]
MSKYSLLLLLFAVMLTFSLKCLVNGNVINGLTVENKQNIPPWDCYSDADVGPCKGYFEHHFCNKTSHKCETFIYGGCYGNQNNFQTIDKCRQYCGGVCDE